MMNINEKIMFVMLMIVILSCLLYLSFLMGIWEDIDYKIEEKKDKKFLKKYKEGYKYQAISYAYEKQLSVYTIREVLEFKQENIEELLTNFIIFLNLKKIPKTYITSLDKNRYILSNIQKLFSLYYDKFHSREKSLLKTTDIPTTTDKEEIKAFLRQQKKLLEIEEKENELKKNLEKEEKKINIENTLFLQRSYY